MEYTFHVQGMTCGHCEMAVKKAVLRLDAKAQVHVDRSQEKVVVHTEQLREAVAQVMAEEGYVVA